MMNIDYVAIASRVLPGPVRDGLKHIRGAIRGLASPRKLKMAIERCRADNLPIRLVLGAGGTDFDDWILTDVHSLDICRRDAWESYFEPDSIDSILSEHVLEHLSIEENRIALKFAFKYLKSGARFRIAVPDGNRQDVYYRTDIAPPRSGHKVVFNLQSLSALLEEAGFAVKPLEYFDENDQFHAVEWNSDEGHIGRSARYDRQALFKKGDFYYTSLIVDAFKP